MPRYVRATPDAEIKQVSGTVIPCGLSREAQKAARAAVLTRREKRHAAEAERAEAIKTETAKAAAADQLKRKKTLPKKG